MENIIKIAKFQYQKLPEETKSGLIETFKGYDHDGSGRIDPIKLLKSFAIPEFVGSDLLYINQFADDDYGRLNFDRFLAAWYAGRYRLRNCHWCQKILPVIYFACRKCEEEDHEFRLCFGCFHGGHYYHKHPAEEMDDINALKPIYSKRSPCAEDDYPVGSEMRQRYLSKELKVISEYRARTGTNYAIMTREIGNFLEELAKPVINDESRGESGCRHEEKNEEEGTDENGNEEKGGREYCGG